MYVFNSDPPALKQGVENLGFGHLNLDVTIPRVIVCISRINLAGAKFSRF